MANPKHLAILKQGLIVWNLWRKENPEIQPQLRGADLKEADLRHMNLCYANLFEADLLMADLRQAMLHNADLSHARLNAAKLQEADLSGANLSRTNLSEATISRAILASTKLKEANLSATKLSNANLRGANLFKANLSGAKLSKANLANAHLRRADLGGANLSSSDLSGADLTRANLVETNLEKANLYGCRIYGISAWSLKLNDAVQTGLVITPTGKPEITVDNLEVAQFIYLLLNNKKIRDVIETISRKVVLILGRFGEHKPILDAIREELRKYDYLPVLFDFGKPATRDFTETVRTLAHLSRFIIADITDPSSIPLELQAVVSDLAVPVQPLLLRGRREFSMFTDLRKKYHWVLATYQYSDISDLLTSLGREVIAPAEQKAKELEKR